MSIAYGPGRQKETVKDSPAIASLVRLRRFQATDVLASEPAWQLSASNSADNAVSMMCISKKQTEL